MRFLLIALLWLGIIAAASASEKHATLSVTCEVLPKPVSTITFTHLPNNVVLMTVYY